MMVCTSLVFHFASGVRGMTTNRVRRLVLMCLLAGFVLATLVAVVATDNAAQAQKDTKGKTEKKESKAEKAPTNYPKRTDLIDPGFGGTQHVTMIDEQITDGW